MSEATLANFHLRAGPRQSLGLLARVVLTDEVVRLGILDEVVDGVELFLRAVPAPVRLGLLAGLEAFEQSARLHPRNLGRRFRDLPLGLAEAHFERWWTSPLAPLHQFAKGARMLVTFSYYEHPKVRELLGYDPEAWIEKVRRERAERFAEEIEAAEAAVFAPDPLPPLEVSAAEERP